MAPQVQSEVGPFVWCLTLPVSPVHAPLPTLALEAPTREGFPASREMTESGAELVDWAMTQDAASRWIFENETSVFVQLA
jgi:hypothetical protein